MEERFKKSMLKYYEKWKIKKAEKEKNGSIDAKKEIKKILGRSVKNGKYQILKPYEAEK